MGIDRKRLEELKGRTPPARRSIRGADDLARACRACRTAGELVAMWPRANAHFKRRGRWQRTRYAEYCRTGIGLERMAEDKDLFVILVCAYMAARDLPSDAPIGPEFWAGVEAGLDSRRMFRLDS